MYSEVVWFDWTDFGGIRKGIRLPIRGVSQRKICLRANIEVQMCRARPSAASLGGLCNVAMRETLYAEVDLIGAVVRGTAANGGPGLSSP